MAGRSCFRSRWSTTALGALACGTLLVSLCGCGSAETSPWNTSTATGTPTGSGGAGATGGSGGAGATGGSGGAGATGGSGGSGTCGVAPACDAPPPDPGEAEPWRHATTPVTTTSLGSARHRGRDLFLRPGDPQWVIAKFAYGLTDKDLVDEDVDIHLLRDCGTEWELLGTAATSDDGDHGTVEGVVDEGGYVFFEIPSASALGLGRHRIHLVVKGDLTKADMFIEVVEPGTTIFVSDVDGTLTTEENEQFYDLLTGATPDANPNSADALGRLAAKGLRPFYLTARPYWLVPQTLTFLAERGYPPGIVHTTLGFTGALNAAATTFKNDELALVAAKELPVAWAFGNRDSDSQAYETAGIAPLDHRVFFQYDDTLGGRRIEDYAELLTQFDALPSLCP